MTPASFWGGQEAYDSILGYTPRLLMASFAAYLLGELANSTILAKMKIWTQGRWLWSRTISSTIVGQGLDSAVFITLAFAGRQDRARTPYPDPVDRKGHLRSRRHSPDVPGSRLDKATGGSGPLRLRYELQPHRGHPPLVLGTPSRPAQSGRRSRQC